MARNASPPDFDFNATCRFFKSSFARTLSLNSGSSNSCRSLDFEQPQQQQQQHYHQHNNIECKSNAKISYKGNLAKSVNGLDVKKPRSHATEQLTSWGNGDHKNEVINIANSTDMQQEQQHVATGHKVELDIKPLTNVSSSVLTQKSSNNILNGTNLMKPVIVQQQQQPQSLPLMLSKQQQQMQQPAFKNTTTTATNTIRTGQQCLEQHQWQFYQHQQQMSLNKTNHVALNKSKANCRNFWSKGINNDENCHKFITTKQTSAVTIPKVVSNITTMESTLKSCSNDKKHMHNKNAIDQLYEMSDSTVNVERVVLRNQVETLQWQLNQVETSCEMYRAVMQEVSRFLERYLTQKQQQCMNQNRLEQISRSRSLHQVYGNYLDISANCSVDEAQSTSYLRASSSSNNLIDIKAKAPATQTIEQRNVNDDHTSYTAFKDFTWRRSPKKPVQALADAEEKLCQEAFRLSRTIYNLINTSTQQPDLSQHRNSLSLSLGLLPKLKTNENNMESARMAYKAKNSVSTADEALFMRSNAINDSRLSVRSSTDSSVHSSTSSCVSSKVETDEEAAVYPTLIVMNKQQLANSGGSTTEDESGFSSVNSFQDVGVPAFSSTLLEREPPLKVRLRPKSTCSAKHPNNILGLPDTMISQPPPVWKVTPATPTTATAKTTHYNANKFQRFSTLSTEEAGAVLWV